MADVFSIEAKGLRDLQGRFAAYADDGLRRRRDEALAAVGQAIDGRLKQLAPRGAVSIPGQGHFADLFRVTAVQSSQGDSALVMVTNADTVTSMTGKSWPLAQLLIMGTRPHTIYPVKATALHFVTDGGAVFAGVVHHPGTRPNSFVEQAIKSANVAGTLRKVAINVSTDLAGPNGVGG